MTSVANRRIPYSRPYIGPEEKAQVMEALESGWITTGPRVKEFEKAFGEYVGASNAIALNSCTSALHLALLGAGVKPGDEVITTPLTFCSTVNTILHVGAKPVLADVDPQTLCLSPAEVERRISPRTKAILPVHYAGCPADLQGFRDLADQRGLKLIDDAAHGIGTWSRGKLVGTLADFTCFSFYATKNLATGDGGMLTTQDDEAAIRLRKLGLHGMSQDAWKRYTQAGTWFYQVEAAGFKYNMTDLAAGLGLAQLARFEWMQAERVALAERYNRELPGLGFELPPQSVLAGDVHSWHLYIARVDPLKLGIERGELIEALKERGIGTSVHFIPIHLHPFYQQELGVKPGDFPVVERSYARMLSLPLYPGLSTEDMDYILARLGEVCEAHRR